MKYKSFKNILKRSDGPPIPEGGTILEGSLTLMSNLLLVFVNIWLDILGKFN